MTKASEQMLILSYRIKTLSILDTTQCKWTSPFEHNRPKQQSQVSEMPSISVWSQIWRSMILSLKDTSTNEEDNQPDTHFFPQPTDCTWLTLKIPILVIFEIQYWKNWNIKPFPKSEKDWRFMCRSSSKPSQSIISLLVCTYLFAGGDLYNSCWYIFLLN